MSALWQILISGALTGGLFIIVASSLTYLIGVSGIVNFAQGEFVMVGGYMAFFLVQRFHLHPLVIVPIAGITCALLGAVLYEVLLKKTVRNAGRHEHDQLIITLGLSFMLQNAALLMFTGTARTINQQLILPNAYWNGIFFSGNAIAGCIAGGVLGLALLLFIGRSRLGRVMNACRQDANLAELSGINVDRTHMISFALSAGLAGIAGVFFVSSVFVFPSVGVNILVTAFAIIVIGSLGNVAGAIFASILVGITISASEAFLPFGATWGYAAPFLLLIVVLIVRPQGLFGREPV